MKKKSLGGSRKKKPVARKKPHMHCPHGCGHRLQLIDGRNDCAVRCSYINQLRCENSALKEAVAKVQWQISDSKVVLNLFDQIQKISGRDGVGWLRGFAEAAAILERALPGSKSMGFEAAAAAMATKR